MDDDGNRTLKTTGRLSRMQNFLESHFGEQIDGGAGLSGVTVCPFQVNYPGG